MDKYTSAAAIERAASLIASADALIVAAGAGMGVDSGLPDFRGKSGFWRAYPALAGEAVDFRSIASPDAFHRMPTRAWGFYGHRLALYRATVPHAGFGLLRRWMQRTPKGGAVFTSNVDGHFQRPGFDRLPIHECHGSIHRLQCLRRCRESVWSAEAFVPDVDETELRLRGALPQCPDCGDPARPNVLLFNDWNWAAGIAEQQQDQPDAWLDTVDKPVVVEVGACSSISTVRNFSARIVAHHGGRLVRINPREFKVSTSLDQGLALGALEALSAIDRVLTSATSRGTMASSNS